MPLPAVLAGGGGALLKYGPWVLLGLIEAWPYLKNLLEGVRGTGSGKAVLGPGKESLEELAMQLEEGLAELGTETGLAKRGILARRERERGRDRPYSPEAQAMSLMTATSSSALGDLLYGSERQWAPERGRGLLTPEERERVKVAYHAARPILEEPAWPPTGMDGLTEEGF